MKQDQERDARKASSNQPAAVAQNLQLNDASGVRRRGKMMLPAPQVSSCTLAVEQALKISKLLFSTSLV